MAEENGNGTGRLRGLAVPAAVSIVGAGVGLVFGNRSKLKEAVPDVKGGVGDLASDLRSRLDSVLGKDDSAGTSKDDSTKSSTRSSSSRSTSTSSELAARRRDRQERRNKRRANS